MNTYFMTELFGQAVSTDDYLIFLVFGHQAVRSFENRAYPNASCQF
jgi:hypothetical protein